MKTFASVELLPLRDVSIASGTAALIAVQMFKGRAIVTCRDYPEIFDDNSTVATLHAV